MEKIFDINYLKSTPEDQHFDRKSARIKPKDILRHLQHLQMLKVDILLLELKTMGK